MPRNIQAMIVEDNQPLVELMQRFFSVKEGIDIVSTAPNSEDAIEKMKTTRVDVIILDLIMPRSDGFVLLEYLNTLQQRPEVIVLTALSDGEIIRRACRLGATYYMIKPFSMEILHERIVGIAMDSDSVESIETKPGAFQRSTDGKIVDHYLETVLSGYGISKQCKAYKYLQEALELIIAHPDFIRSITKQLYPEIGRKYDCSPVAVERSIRRVIEDAWNSETIQRGENPISELFDSKHRPTNREFISLIISKVSNQPLPLAKISR